MGAWRCRTCETSCSRRVSSTKSRKFRWIPRIGAKRSSAEPINWRRKKPKSSACSPKTSRRGGSSTTNRLAKVAERASHEAANRVRNICDRWAVRLTKPGQRRFILSSDQVASAICGCRKSSAISSASGRSRLWERLPTEETTDRASRPRIKGRKPRSLPFKSSRQSRVKRAKCSS